MSKEGKGVLVKSVLQAVPTYTMGCFMLPKKLCGQLTSVSSNFWWGANEGQRKVHWISWDRMCEPKGRGGLGFRNYSDFNQALLAKQAWRIVTNPDSLCSRVLRARYFKAGDILTASCPKRASYTWRSILHGRDLLKEGLIWRVGDGTNIKVWEDNWIPRSSLKRPLGRLQDAPENFQHVSELLLPDGSGWDVDKLRANFFEMDVTDILKISVGRAGTEDNAAWNYTKNGMLNVRLA